MNMCREHSYPSQNQKPGAKSGACIYCPKTGQHKHKKKPVPEEMQDVPRRRR